jgi:hypothetical protein
MKPLLTVLFVFASIVSYSQEYQVLHVKGKIVLEKDGTVLKAGDKISEKDKIRFESKDAMAAVLSNKKGRYIIKVKEETSNESDLVYVLKSAISPVRGGMSSRAGVINNDIDFKLYFAEAPFVWAGEVIKLGVSSVTYPMDDEQFFYIQYSIAGDKVSKKLSFEKDILIIEKKSFFSIDGSSINPEKVTNYSLYYYNSANEESRLITEIDFVLISQEELQQIFDQYPVKDEDTYYEIADVLSNLYGKCDPLQLENNIRN